MFEMKLSDVPEYFIRDIAGVIHSYSTPLIKVTPKNGRNENAILIGSGTFVTIQGVHGILTAYHVAHQLEIGCLLGLILIPKEHRNTTEFQHLEIVDIAKGANDADGPDLSFIVLPSTKVSEIKPYKHFIDFVVDREILLYKPPEIHDGIWFLCGALGEKTKEEKSTRGLSQVLSVEGTCSALGVDRFYTQDGFDYVEADIEYGKGLDIRSTFGGMSGGGLWQVTFKKNSNETLEAVRFFYPALHFISLKLENQKDSLSATVAKVYIRMSIIK